MAELGRGLLFLALAVSLWGVISALMGATSGRRAWVASARRSAYALALLTTIAFALLEAAFLRTDLSFSVVQSHSSTTTPLFYRATAAWSSQEGSMLLWLWLLSLWTALVLWRTQHRLRDVQPWATAILLGFATFFAGLLVLKVSPFAVLANPPAEGVGLNPLLRYPSMMSHPPALYAGYTLWAVPFAYAAGALIVRRVDAEWLVATRRFALGAWLCLGIGILLGARWSYAELGWGGYWGWDPVENASLLPWLTGTAFIHSVMVQEKRGMLKLWNASLVLATGTLAIFGTFLVRSGIVSSIHAFTGSELGWPFVTLIIAMALLSVWLIISRRSSLRTEHRLDSLLSREAMFLYNNIVLVAMAFVVLWGTMFPVTSEALSGREQTLGPTWYGRYTAPLALVLVALTAVGPVVPWRRATWRAARRHLLAPLAAAVVTAVVLAVLGAASRPLALLLFALAAAAIVTALAEFKRGIAARSAMSGDGPLRAFTALMRRNRRRYGGYVVHLGIVVLLVGVAASSAFQKVTDVRMRPGEKVDIGSGYSIRYERPVSGVATLGDDVERIVLGARTTLLRDGRPVARLEPERGYYPVAGAPMVGALSRYFDGESTSEVMIRSSPRRDVWVAVMPDTTRILRAVKRGDRLYAALAAKRGTGGDYTALLGRGIGALVGSYRTEAPPATFRAIVSPMVFWVWVGGLITGFGGILCLWPAGAGARRRERAAYAAQVAREVGRAGARGG